MRAFPATCAIAVFALLASTAPRADEGGVSFWLPGQFGSLAAVPGTPGWSLGSVYYHLSADAGGSREFVVGGRVVAGLDARGDLVFVVPTFTFAQPVAGGQASLALAGAFGRMRAGIDATLTGPRGNAITLSEDDAKTGGSDLYPLGTLKWNRGVHNFMVYAMAGIPVGAYQKGRLANIGLNHWSIDGGGGYAHFDPKTGREFSVVGGLTYNFENDDTDYRNGVDGHIDWGASQFISEATHVGLVGYFYHQLSGDSGSGAVLGDNKSRTNGIGPQLGHFFPFAGGKAYVNLKGYYEFDAKNRAEGWNVWLSVLVPLSGTPSK